MSELGTLADARPPDGGRPVNSRRLKVLTLKDRYPTSFHSPRASRHDVRPTVFVPFNKIRSNWDGFTLLPPVGGVDLVHAYNRIPLNAKRYICSFESSMPRDYGFPQSSQLLKLLQSAVNSRRCRRIIGLSHFARRNFLRKQDKKRTSPGTLAAMTELSVKVLPAGETQRTLVLLNGRRMPAGGLNGAFADISMLFAR